jgi:hypothetical protein
VVMTVNVLNVHVGLFINMVFVVEFTPGGGFVNSYNFRSFKSSLYGTKFVVVFVVLFSILFIFDFFKKKQSISTVSIWFDWQWRLFGQQC